MPGPCPTPERLAAALRGRQPGREDAELAAHLAECPACQAQLESLAGGSSWLEGKARTHAASTAPEPLRQAMQVLETHADISEREHAPPPKLDFLQPADQPDVLGRFGPYEVIQHIASGGMGIVLKARDPALDRVVALKILPPTLAANSLARSRFVREARAAAAVVHEHVVPIYAVDECASLPYIVMQFVQGRSLSERLRATGPLRLEEVLRIGAQTAAGLAAAHAQGLVHRDVKPGNILLENSVERVKLTDFGLARAADDVGLTRTGELAGTPEFMSPEQAGNEAVDHRSDLFSFGSVLYAMCTGCSPFQASSVIAAVRKVCDEQPPPVHEINTAIPRWLSDIIVRLMAKLPTERFQSAREVGELLERYLARVQHGDLDEISETSHARLAAGRARRRIAIGAVACLAVIALLIFRLKHKSSSPSSSQPVTSLQNSFLVRKAGATNVQSFSTLAAAIENSSAGAVIECRYTGDWPIEPLDLGDKPLTIRAVANTKPTFVITRRPGPLLRTRAPLALEGLTFKIPAMQSQPSLSLYHSIFSESVIESSNAPLFMANCRIELVAPLNGPMGGGCCVGLLDNSFAAFQNCEFYAPINGGIGHLHTTASALGAISKPDRIIVRNCVQTGFYFVHLKDAQDFNARVELTRNTALGSCAIGFSERPQNTPIIVAATQNVFVVEHVVGAQPRAWMQPAEKLLRWIDATNLINVKKGFTRTRPALATIDQWQNFIDGWKGGVPVELNLSKRIMELRTDMNQFTPARFLLSEAETQQLERIVPGLSDVLGVQSEICGPGEPYDRWKRSPAYADWQRETHEAFVGQRSRGSPLKPSSPSPVQEPFLVLTETGKNVGAFTNIVDALAAAPSGGIVEFRWNGSREMPPVTLPPKPLTLRAAKAFRPIWIHTNLSMSAFSGSAALTVEDIELSLRPDATALPGRSRPRPRMTPSAVGLIAISNAPLRVSRCVLQLPDPRSQPRGSQLSAAGLTVIILDNVATCELENSALLAAPRAAILWRRTPEQNATVADEGSEARLSLSNCVVTGFKVFSPELPENSRSRLQIVRCTFQARHLIDFSEAGAGRGLTVIAMTNVFAMGAMVWDERSTNRDVLTASMRWRGWGNLFSLDAAAPRAGAYVVLSRSTRESWPDTLAEWNQWWPTPETGSREATVTFADAANVPASASHADFVRAAYKVDRMTFKDGPPLTPDQWSHFGANTANVGPRSVK